MSSSFFINSFLFNFKSLSLSTLLTFDPSLSISINYFSFILTFDPYISRSQFFLSPSIPLSLFPIIFPFILTFDIYIYLAKFFSASIPLSLVYSQRHMEGYEEYSSGGIWWAQFIWSICFNLISNLSFSQLFSHSIPSLSRFFSKARGRNYWAFFC